MPIERANKILREIRKRKQTARDHDNQPTNKAYNESRIMRRTVDEFTGICKGILSDNVVNQQEAEFLAQWVITNEHAAHIWPIDIIFDRLNDFLADDILDDEEQQELQEILKEYTGTGAVEKFDNYSSALPLTQPEPKVLFEGREFCFTGKFVLCNRTRCIEIVQERGGFFNPIPRQNTDYLVIGLVGSRDWLHTTHGVKIETALQMIDEGHDIAILSERHWAKYV